MNQQAQPGFILPLAAVGVALLALGLTMGLPADELAGRELGQADRRLAVEQAAIIAEARLTYLLLSEPAGLRGLEIGGGRLAADGSFRAADGASTRRELVFDSRPYRLDLAGRGSFIVRIQDEAGLVGIGTPDTGLLRILAEACRLTPAEREALAQSHKAARFNRAMPAAGPAKPALFTAISTVNSDPVPRLPTAPASVVFAASNGNTAVTETLLRRRNILNNVAEMAVYYIHNDYNMSQKRFRWGSLSNKLRIYVEPFQSSLNVRLPIYSYSSRVSAEDNDPKQHFLPQGSMTNAGSWTQCYQSPGEAVVPLPYPGQPVF